MSDKVLRLLLIALCAILAMSGCSKADNEQSGGSITGNVATNDTASEAPKILGVRDADAVPEETPSAYFVSPADGDTVYGTFKVVFGLKGMGVAPAGVKLEGTGHHHLLIDLAELPDMSLPLPSTDNIRHFGLGQTETWLTLPPGEHKLQLLLADFAHVPHDTPIVSAPISITVVE